MRTLGIATWLPRFVPSLAVVAVVLVSAPAAAQFAQQPAPQQPVAQQPGAQPGAVPYAPQAPAPQFQFQSREAIIVGKATEVLRAFSGMTIRQIPPAMLVEAEAVIVVPELIKAGLLPVTNELGAAIQTTMGDLAAKQDEAAATAATCWSSSIRRARRPAPSA